MPEATAGKTSAGLQGPTVLTMVDGGPGAPVVRTCLCVRADAADRDFLAQATAYGRGLLTVVLRQRDVKRLSRACRGAPAGSVLTLCKRGAERPGNAEDLLATVTALAVPHHPSDFVSPGAVRVEDSSPAGGSFPLAEVWVAAGGVGADLPLALVDLDPDRLADAAADLAGLPALRVDCGEVGEGAGSLVRPVVVARLPTRFGEFTAHGYRSTGDGREVLALVRGRVQEPATPVYVHGRCHASDTFGATSCDCGTRLRRAQMEIGSSARGVIVQHGSGGDLLCPAGSPPDPELDAEIGEVLGQLGCEHCRVSSNHEIDLHVLHAGIRRSAAAAGSTIPWYL